MTHLALSLFPGIGLMDRGFEAAGFCVVRGPDLLWGGDVRKFHPPPGRFDGVIGGPPCQDFSKLRRQPETGQGVELLQEMLRIIVEAQPRWFLIENVPGVPSVTVQGFSVQRFDVCAWEFGVEQSRRRHFQFGSGSGKPLAILRACDSSIGVVTQPAATASEARRSGRRDWPAFCSLMGVTELELPGFTVDAKYRAVGNGVPVPVAAGIAKAIAFWCDSAPVVDLFGVDRTPVCACGCGRVVTGQEKSAGPACRKRMERKRRGRVTVRGVVTVQGICGSGGDDPIHAE